MRSFVVDSSFNFDSIDGLLDEPMLLLMIGNSYLLSLALGFALITMYQIAMRALPGVHRPGRRLLVLLAGTGWSLGLLLLTTEGLLLPLWTYAAYALLFGAPMALRTRRQPVRSGTLFAPLLVAAVLGSVLTVGLFRIWMETKRASEIEAIAIDFARPVDGWSQVLMEQTLQYASRADIPDATSLADAGARDYAAAFRVWAGSPLSRLQNNSAILLLDSSGVPRSRFAVGNDPFLLSMHTLSSTVARTEGIVQRTDRQMENRERRYYQGYTDILTRARDGLVAVVILEALDPMEMAGQGIDLLRNAPATLSSAPEDQFIISRFHGQRMVQTSDRRLERAQLLPAEVRVAFAQGNENTWHTLPVDGEQLRTYFMRMPEPDGDVLAITRGTAVPLLTAFRALRIAVLFVCFSAVIWFFAALAAGRLARRSRMTFARRLQMALLGIAAIPLLLIWMTGREFALETSLAEIERQVTEDLDVLRANILEQLPDSVPVQDLTGHVSDQICQEIRLRSGRDVNIYRGTELTATSKPELYHVGLLNSRLHPVAWLNIVERGRDAWFTTERIGDFSYQVGYRAVRTEDGGLAAVISTPTLFQREQIDRGYTRASATIFLWLVAIAVLVLFASAALARQISRPLSELLRATRDITAGDLDRRVHVAGSAEIVDLMDAFNTMTARLRRSQEELAAAERELAWKEMAKQVAHEIRNPLTPMKLAVQHLQRTWHDGAEQIGDIVDKVTRTLIDQIESLSRISDEFSRFARMPRRSTARVDIGETLREAVALFGSHEHVQFSLQLEHGLPTVLADREELSRAVANLLRNALQATHDHGEISISAGMSPEGIRILISDTGIGIPPELLPRIFEPNFSTKTEGMGLGLAIVKKIIDDAGGTIRIESTAGEGTTVIVTLPAT
jgi:two-component system, NtrC family, nitrogen regulation sensor histidine kinase NtrY